MQTSLQIEFAGVEPAPQLRAAIDRHVAELESRSGHVTSGRIVIRAPGERHRTGGQYQVAIHLALPDGREVNIGRTPPEDERYADLTFAIDDAFRRARRQLKEQAELLRGEVKHHQSR